ncbi:MAG: M3 family metallopeptidase [Bacteroidales bacterium]|nr:M3 family metallopeptidase [Bacteroidales bacterium]
MNNPFFSEWDTPYGIPDFQKIKPEHYLPAMKEGMKLQKAEINEIVKSKEAPTFENTIVAYERSGAMLDRVTMVFFNLMESNNSDELEAIANEAMPLLTAHGDDIALNAGLFERVAQVYSQRDTLGLEPEDMRLLEETYKSFVRNGANVPQEQQQRFRDINTQIASLSLRFGNNVLKASNEYRLVLDENQLDGLTPAQIEAAREAADESDDTKGKYVITLHNPSLLPFLTNSTNRELRQQIWEAYSQRCTSGKYDNRQIIDSLVNLRLERAKILGFDNHAAYVLDDCMAKTPQAVYDCLNQLWTPALNKAKAECREYEQMLRADGYDALQPWDWRYYSEKLRKQRYALDDDTIRQYLPLERVRQGAFDVATKLYGITFRENGSLPNYDPEATAYEVLDGDTVIAILYMDFFPRASKRSGAWMTNFREQYVDSKGNNVIPIIQIVCNFSKPSGGKPALLDFDEAETLFHEFGHSLHGMLSRCHYKSLSGTNVPRDFVELPSQVMENWCRHPQVIKEYARHYATGEPIPNKLIDKIIAAQTYGQGFVNTELLAASLLDMDYHTINEPRHIELPQFEDDDMARIGLIPQIISRYRSTYFQHIFSGGYSAGYYSYTWTAILDADAFEAFRESGDLYNPVLARKFRHILESGNTSDLMELYRQFRGKDPSVQPLLRNRGLI